MFKLKEFIKVYSLNGKWFIQPRTLLSILQYLEDLIIKGLNIKQKLLALAVDMEEEKDFQPHIKYLYSETQ